MSNLDVESCRKQFPALHREVNGLVPVYFDGPAGSQTPQSVVDAMASYMLSMNANHGGAFATSRASDALLDEAHRAAADFVGVDDPDEIAFGANMTTLTLALSRALGRTWRAGDEVIVTRLDHDANVSPWMLAARDAGATVKHVAVRREDGTLDLDDLKAKLSSKTRLVAVGAASNAVGTVNPVAEIVRLAHGVGAQVFVDAVHYAPHRRIDVRGWGCDYLACSAYKFFGPHVGVLWGRRELLQSLPAYKLRVAPDELPGKWETGTLNHEGIAGVLAAVDYLAGIGRQVQPATLNRRAALDAAFEAIAAHERSLTIEMLAGLQSIADLTLYGIVDRERLAQRVPTFAVRHARLSPLELAERLDARGIYTWHGNFYALPWTEFMGLEPDGVLRIGLLHYNTPAEIARLIAALEALT